MAAFRNGWSDDRIVEELGEAVRRKQRSLGGHEEAVELAKVRNRPMILIGG